MKAELLESRADVDVSAPVRDLGDQPSRWDDPLGELRRAAAQLAEGATLSATFPNVRHRAVVGELLAGRWRPGHDGTRHFTRREVEKLLFRAGLSVRSLRAEGPDHAAWVAAGRPAEVRAGGLLITGLPPADVEDFHAAAWRVEAAPAPRPDFGLTSIVILTYNQLPLTQACLDSIRRFTDEPYELIVVDNASRDGTPDWLAAQPDVRLIANAENRGYPAGNNQGIAVATGRQILLLNNDTVVTTGWLSRMLTALRSSPDVGLVGPSSNNVSGEQQIPIGYETPEELDGWAWEHGRAHAGRRESTDRLVGFCLLASRELVQAIGGLDERFGVGCFEDDDWCRRALAAGFRCVIARDAFVHHVGHASFRAAGIDLGEVLRRNQQLYREKWAEPTQQQPAQQQPTPQLSPAKPHALPTPPSVTAQPRAYAVRETDEGLLLERTSPRLSLAMIVRNNIGTLGPCLESIRPWVDEMVVVDTGSTDGTDKLAERLGARLYHMVWPDCFSTARNESLRHCRGEWIFWMDSDDVITRECGRQLRRIALGSHPSEVLGYVCQVHCLGPGQEGRHDITAVDHVKLIRNRPELRFEGRIHEQILMAIRRAGGQVAWTDIYVTHAGYDHSPEGQARKLARDLRLLGLELAERPEHPFTLFNLGMTHADTENFAEAADYLRRSLSASNPGESHRPKAYALLAHCLHRLGRAVEAIDTCRQGLAEWTNDVELRFRLGVLLHEVGRSREAIEVHGQLLADGPHGGVPRRFGSRDQGLTSFKARQNLAVTLTELGDVAAAEREWRTILSERPDYAPARAGLVDSLQRRGRLTEARAEAEAAARGYADQPESWEVLARLLFETAGPAAALGALRELVSRSPADAAARHNFGAALLAVGDRNGARAELLESLRLWPGHTPTEALLAQLYSTKAALKFL